MQLQVPNPCSENWNEMQPEEKGRYCMVCSKTVIDFTGMEPEAIMDYIQQQRGQHVCGRFTADQLDQKEQDNLNWPLQIAVSGLSFFKKVAAVIVVVFGLAASSCKENGGQVKIEKKIEKDTVVVQNEIAGLIALPPSRVADNDTMQIKKQQKAAKSKRVKEVLTTAPHIVGELAVPDSLVTDSLPQKID